MNRNSLLVLAAVAMPRSTASPDLRIVAVKQVIDRIWAGWETNDRAAVERQLASQFVDTDFSGVRRTKAEALAFLAPRRGPRAAISITRSNYRFQFHGEDTAVVSYRAQDCRTERNGPARCLRFAATDTLVLEGGRWRLAAGQQIMIPADADDEAEMSRREVLAVADAIDRAQLRIDSDALGQQLSDRWTLVHAKGLVVDKARYLNDVRAFWRPNKVSYGERTVSLRTDGAVVSGLVSWEWMGDDKKPMRATERFSDVCDRDFGRWQRSRSHVSCVTGACG